MPNDNASKQYIYLVVLASGSSSLIWRKLCMVPIMEPKRFTLLRWPEPIYMRVRYVFESRFSAGMIKPISMIFGILNNKWSNFKKCYLFSYR